MGRPQPYETFAANFLSRPAVEDQQILEVLNVLTDTKLSMVRGLLVRTVFNKYYEDYDQLHLDCLTLAVESRGTSVETFSQTLGIFYDHVAVQKVLAEIQSI